MVFAASQISKYTINNLICPCHDIVRNLLTYRKSLHLYVNSDMGNILYYAPKCDHRIHWYKPVNSFKLFCLSCVTSILIKMRSLTCSFWLICCGLGDEDILYYRSHASHPILSSKENGDCETIKVWLNCFKCYKPKRVITIFTCIISLYIHDIMSLTCDP